MNLQTTLSIYAGGPGSGCNPDVGTCGRKSGAGIPVSAGIGNEKMGKMMERVLSKVSNQVVIEKLAQVGIKVRIAKPGAQVVKSTYQGGHAGAFFNSGTKTIYLFTTTGGSGGMRGEQSWGILKEYLLHELGHAVDYSHRDKEQAASSQFVRTPSEGPEYTDLYKKYQSKFGGYGSGRQQEHFAEAFKSFLTHPDKMQEKMPDLHTYFTKKVNDL